MGCSSDRGTTSVLAVLSFVGYPLRTCTAHSSTLKTSILPSQRGLVNTIVRHFVGLHVPLTAHRMACSRPARPKLRQGHR